MAEDRGRGVVLLLSGQGTAVYNDAWEWDGTDWRQTVVGPATPTAMAYDAARQRMVVIAQRVIGAFVRDTWEFDGTTWTLRHSTTPSFAGIDSPGLAYDESRRVCVLHGIVRPSGALVTEEWDGTSWQPVNTPGTATAATYTLLYDSARQRVMSLGEGIAPTNFFQGHQGTWFYGRDDLRPLVQEVRVGQPLQWTIDLPGEAYRVFFCGLSTDSAGGIPVGANSFGSVLVWPLRPSLLLEMSLGVPTLWGALDATGRGTVSVPVPADPSLDGFSLSASAVSFDLVQGGIGAITRDVRALVVR